MRIEDEQVRLYRRLFCHRRDAYGLQNDDGTYRAVREPVTEELIRDHLLGRVTAGWYTLDRDDTVRWAALDADGEDGLAQLQKVGLALEEWGWPAYLEDSRRGGHLWIFFPRGERKERIGAGSVRVVLGHLLDGLGLEEEIELFPKQDQIGEGGLGNLVRGPLGVHRACGRRFGFLDLDTRAPVGETLEEQLDHVSRFQAVTGAQVARELARMLTERARRRPPSHPRRSFPGGEDPIQALKEEIGDLYTFVSRFVELDEQGKGHCPFHPPDRHPSFAVNRKGDYWVDFHDMTGGDAIAFYQRLEGIGFREAFEELAEMYQRPDLVHELTGREDKKEVLSEQELWLLGSAEENRLLCPQCGAPLQGEFEALAGSFVGVLLYCERCSFVDALSAPRRRWKERGEDGDDV